MLAATDLLLRCKRPERQINKTRGARSERGRAVGDEEGGGGGWVEGGGGWRRYKLNDQGGTV